MPSGSKWLVGGKSHYERNRQKYIDKARSRKHAIYNIVLAIKRAERCKDCGHSDWRVLDFDHLGDKEMNISEAAWLGWSVPRLLKEVLKCEIRCANCHRIKTIERKNKK